jgi:GntR family transcriptional regulator, transcriptional repressor for pyruvate dehydrogenase complex
MKTNSSELVADRIRAFVISKRLAPGQRLGREEDLARRFGVSRPTLREALRLLASEHLVRASKGPGGGIFVAATPEQGIGKSVSAAVESMLEAHSIRLDELLETRLLLEVPIAGLAAQRAGEQDVAKLKALISELDDQVPDLERITELDARLHHLIAQIAGNRLAGAFGHWIVDVLQPRLATVIEPAVIEAVIADQHRDLVVAIVRGDPIAAERAMREHLVYLGDLVAAVAAAQRPDDQRPAGEGPS